MKYVDIIITWKLKGSNNLRVSIKVKYIIGNKFKDKFINCSNGYIFRMFGQ